MIQKQLHIKHTVIYAVYINCLLNSNTHDIERVKTCFFDIKQVYQDFY